MNEQKLLQEYTQIIHQKGLIRDEMVFHIMDMMSEKFVDSQEDFPERCYEQLLGKLNKLWQYKQLEELSSEQSYLYGGIWGCLSMLSWIQKKKKTSQRCHTLAEKYQVDSMFTFLSAVYKKPGIQNKDLAQICKVSTARISQISNDALGDGLISMQSLGREKSYFIRTSGEAVYDILKKKKNKITMSLDKQLDYKMIFFSNEENDFSKKVAVLNQAINQLSSCCNVGVAVAFSEKSKEISTPIRYELMKERGRKPWESVMTNSSKKYNSFCKAQKEAGMIN